MEIWTNTAKLTQRWVDALRNVTLPTSQSVNFKRFYDVTPQGTLVNRKRPREVIDLVEEEEQVRSPAHHVGGSSKGCLLRVS